MAAESGRGLKVKCKYVLPLLIAKEAVKSPLHDEKLVKCGEAVENKQATGVADKQFKTAGPVPERRGYAVPHAEIERGQDELCWNQLILGSRHTGAGHKCVWEPATLGLGS